MQSLKRTANPEQPVVAFKLECMLSGLEDMLRMSNSKMLQLLQSFENVSLCPRSGPHKESPNGVLLLRHPNPINDASLLSITDPSGVKRIGELV